MRAIAMRWDAAVRAAVPAFARLVPEAEARGSVLRPGASESELANAEARLGMELPTPYRSFLRVSDGADAGLMGADTVHRVSERASHGLLRSAGVDHFEPMVPGLLAMWRDAMSDFAYRQEVPDDDVPVQVLDFAGARRALCFTVPEQDNIAALVDTGKQWQVWEFAHSEVFAHRSFATFLQVKTRQATQQVSERAARLASGEDPNPRRRLIDLAEAGDPLTVELAYRAFSEPSSADEQQFAATYLRMIGDPQAIPVLQAALRAGIDPPLAVLVLFALDSCGDSDAIPQLQRIVDEGHPGAGWAAGYLDRHDRCPTW